MMDNQYDVAQRRTLIGWNAGPRNVYKESLRRPQIGCAPVTPRCPIESTYLSQPPRVPTSALSDLVRPVSNQASL